MVPLTETHFTYAGVDSRELGVMMLNLETARNTNLNGEIMTMRELGYAEKRAWFISDDYSNSPFTTEVEIVSDSDEPLVLADQRRIEKWLFYKQGYKKLFFDDLDDCEGVFSEIIDGNVKRLYLNCRFTNPTRIVGNGGVFGYRATLESDSPLAWQEEITQTISVNNATASASKNISVTIDTDLPDFTYPRVTVQMGSAGGDVIISNNTDDPARLTSFDGITGLSSFIIDGRANFVSGNNYTKFSDKNFIRLLDGENTISIVGNVSTITFTWQNRRWL